jgi:hypothetical protein
MYNKDLNTHIEQDIALEEAQDIGSLDEDPSEINNKQEENISVTEIEYPDLDDVETHL